MATLNASSTFYLTPEEDARIRKTVKDRLQKCQAISGQERARKDPKELHSTVTGASLMADMNQSAAQDGMTTGSDAMPVLGVGSPYSPCVLSIEDLAPMKLSELKMETHHRGRVLRVRKDDPVVTLKSRSWTAVTQEGEKDAERLEVVLHKTDCGEDFLESAKHFYIKEPYFTITEQGEPTIRVDHPSDIIVNVEAEGMPVASREPEGLARAAGFRKSEGNAALRTQDFTEAHSKYSEGLRTLGWEGDAVGEPDKIDLVCDLYRNRAHVNLALYRFDEAKSDAMSALSSIDDEKHRLLDSKAYFRAGCAAYSLGDFLEARDLFEKQKTLTPGDRDAAASLRKTSMRLREGTLGEYDLSKVRVSLSRARPRVEAADFTSRTVVKDTPHAGRGLFATCDIQPDQMIICEKAFCVVWGHEEETWTAMTYDIRDDRIRGAPAGLTKAIVQKLRNNPSKIPAVINLFGDYTGNGKESIIKDGIPVIDTFQIHDIVARNAFGPGAQYGHEDVKHASTGLWVHAAYINHSCMPNATKSYVGDLIVLHATRYIEAGEEIFHSYDESIDYDARSAALMNTWGFECDCALCKVEKLDDPAVRKKRRELVQEADVLMSREEPAKAKKLTITKVKRLATLIAATYDEKRYAGLPKKALEFVQSWINAAGSQQAS